MSVTIKRSDPELNIVECEYRCCTDVHGRKEIQKIRRRVRRTSKNRLKRDFVNENY